jgi:hypothetical protein
MFVNIAALGTTAIRAATVAHMQILAGVDEV